VHFNHLLGQINLASYNSCLLTHNGYPSAEWAMARLQAEAAYQLKVMQVASSSANNDEQRPSDENPPSSIADASPDDSRGSARLVGRYHCTSRNCGHLTVATKDVSFKQDLTNDRSRRLGYDQRKAMQKVHIRSIPGIYPHQHYPPTPSRLCIKTPPPP
jgi:hypothetical protein